jgi:hypothetical protein
VTRCCQVGALRSPAPQAQIILADQAVGIRRTTFWTKLIRKGDEPNEVIDFAVDGSFGRRPPWRDDLVIADVLSALRLYKHAQIYSAGYARWSDSYCLNSISYQQLAGWPYGNYVLSEDEVPRFIELWQLMEEGSARLSFSIHRFNLAFDRGLLPDRIVDLVIAAEALFLSDLGIRDRGELRYRFSLRAAKFIEHPIYGEREIFHVMRGAYDARSAVVHGGSPEDTKLPNNEAATLPQFIDAVEELVRLGLRKGLSLKGDAKKLRHADYWNDLILAKPNKQ